MSSLQPIPYQPLDLATYPELDICPDCDDAPEPCLQYTTEDPLSLQLRNEPQPYALCVNPCTNPSSCNFEYNVNLCSGAGNLTLGGDWTYDTPCTVAKTAENAISTVTVSNGALPTPGQAMRFEIYLDAVTSGSVTLRLGTLSSEAFTTTGTHEWVVYVDAANVAQDLEIEASLDFLGRLLVVKGFLLSNLWQVEGDGWYYDGELCGWRHRTTAPLQSYRLYYYLPLPANVYKITLRVEDLNAQQAFLTVQLGNFTRTIYTNGTVVLYTDLTSGGAGSILTFLPSNTFDGVVTLLSLETSTRGHLALLYNNLGQPYAYLPAPYYEGDHVTWNAPDWSALTDLNGDPIQAGCYTVGVLDAGEVELGQYLGDPLFENLGVWTVVNEGGDDVWNPVPFPTLSLQNFSGRVVQALAGVDPDDCYRLHVEIVPAFNFLGQPLPVSGDLLVLLNASPIYANTLTSGVSFDINLTGLNPGDTITFELVNATFAFYRAQLFDCVPYVTAGDASFLSPCVSLQTTQDCDSYFLEGQVPGAYYDDQLLSYVSPVAFGLQFNPSLHLGMRVPAYFLNPTDEGEDSSYDYRNGRKQRTAASTQHNWDLVIGRQTARQHGALATIARCPQVQLSRYPVTTPGPLYVILSDDYAPNWAKGTRAKTADVSLEITRLENSRRYLRRVY